MPRRPVTHVDVARFTLDGVERSTDLVAVEEPLQMILEHGEPHARHETPLAITMRTPGQDHDLVRGFLFAEGVITHPTDLLSLRHCQSSDTPANVIRAALKPEIRVPTHLIERNLTVTSACGVCGDRTLETLVKTGCEPLPSAHHAHRPDSIRVALSALETSQAWFRHTGGTHGAALFNADGELLQQREDVGRHNALDKLVGASLGTVTLPHSFVVVSSRASFELVQKAVRARVPLLVAIGAPTSLAIETAKRFNLSLVGFAKNTRFNVYSGAERIALDAHFVDVGAAE
jgi:FdhD protein